MTVQQDFYDNNIALVNASQKLDMLISTTLLLAMAETPELTLDQVYQTFLNSPGEMNKLLDTMLIDAWTYVSVYPAMKTRLDEIIKYREQLRGITPAKAINAAPLDLGNANVNGAYLLWKGIPENARLASLQSSLLLRGAELLTNQFEEFCHSLSSSITTDDLYKYLMLLWPVKRFPTQTFNTTFQADAASGIPSSWIFNVAVALGIQGAIENQAFTPLFCNP